MRFVKLLAIGLAIFICWNSCVNHDIAPQYNLKISLRWVRSYPTQTKEDIITGLAWTLSFLGAELPEGSLQRAVEWKGSKFVLDISQVGFNNQAQNAFNVLIDFLKTSEEYAIHGGVDVGRFVMLTLNSTNHYYAITGAQRKLSMFRSLYDFDDKKAAVLVSTIAFGSRLIEIGKADHFNEVAFIAAEGKGSIRDGTFTAEEFETMDFMSNGQLRFALYDVNGNLKAAASTSLTAAGKPAKCLWCHETNLLPPFTDNHELLGYYSTKEFKKKLEDRMTLMHNYRAALKSDIDYTNLRAHTQAELLYLSFMEPSAERLAEEWGITLQETKLKLAHVSTHTHNEFAFLGNALYLRKDVEDFSPYPNIQVPADPRNPSPYEPDFIH